MMCRLVDEGVIAETCGKLLWNRSITYDKIHISYLMHNLVADSIPVNNLYLSQL